MASGQAAGETNREVSDPAQQATFQPKNDHGRLYFADNLRTYLIVLVVLHHIAIVYGAVGAFYYYEPPYNDPLAYAVLIIFAAVDQAYFMGPCS